jgi:hypothetical protein
MKITLESSGETRIVLEDGSPPVRCRLWSGATDDGRPLHAYIARVLPLRAEDHDTFAAELHHVTDVDTLVFAPAPETLVQALDDEADPNGKPDGTLAYLVEISCTPPDRTDPSWPLPSMDARDWAQAFMAQYKPADPGEEIMLVWFANALMRGFDEGQLRARAEAQQQKG